MPRVDTFAEIADERRGIADLASRLTDACLQLFGGYGYMLETPIAELWADARVTRIYGGTNEIMKELASRSM